MEMDLNKIITVGIILLTFAVLFAAAHMTFKKLLQKKNKLPYKFLRSTTNAVLAIILIYTLLSEFDATKEISTSLLRSGTLIIALLTFAAQKTLGNVISGFSISMSRPIETGQKIKLLQSGSVIAEGIVKDMTIRQVVIEQFDGQTCIVPNSVVDTCVIINTNYIEHIGNFLEFEISYDSDIQKAKDIIREECSKEKLLLPEPVTILTSRVSQNGMVLKFAVWTRDLDGSYTACSNLRENIVKAFMDNAIDIPYSTVDVRIQENRK